MQLGGGTKKGWSISLNILISLIIWSTCFNFKISDFFKIFSATYLSFSFHKASLTLPKDPAVSGADFTCSDGLK